MALHRQAEEFLQMVAPAGERRIYEMSAPEARARFASRDPAVATGPSPERVSDLTIPVSGAQIAARRYEPADSHGTIVWLHGGGWVFDGLDGVDAMCRTLAPLSAATVIDVDYRVAPEHPFPVPLDDCFDALCWIAALEGSAPLIVGGDSAGGNLTAACTLRARERGGPAVAGQVLVYPVTDCDLETPSYLDHGVNEQLALGAREMAWFFDQYEPDPAARSNPEISPLRAGDLSGLPPAIVVVAEYDPLRDDSTGYAEALRTAGVEVTMHHYDDMPHGFFAQVGILDASLEAIGAVARWCRATLDGAA